MNSVIVLQARTNSFRLPAKVMLPINGIPLVVLAAKRAANTGLKVIIATSNEPSDDGLVALIQRHGISYYRGSLENTLDRVVNALSSYDNNTIVFRLTADNVFPDGKFLDEIKNEFLNKNIQYICCNGQHSGLPYGMSAEVTRLGHLREAAMGDTDDYDKEHVTPSIIRKFGLSYFEKYLDLRKGHFRCTVDCLDDYFVAQKVFSDVIDPIQESFLDLVTRLEKAPFQPITSSPIPKLVLGTAQLGFDYGIANKTGQPSKSQCQELIKTAITNGVIYLDTARAYGTSENMIGHSLRSGWSGRAKIITKLSPLEDCPKEISKSALNAFVESSVFQSCTALGTSKIDVLMLHRASLLSEWNGSVWQRLLELQALGVIGELGVSVQNPEELSKALSVPEITYIQLPYNLLDWRWDMIVMDILAIKMSRKLTIHVRSVFLQGLLPSTDNTLWLRANVEQVSIIKEWLLNQVGVCQRQNIIDLCISYVNALDWVDGIAIGVDNIDQLLENINYFSHPNMSTKQVKLIQSTRPKLSEATLNPSAWKKGSL